MKHHRAVRFCRPRLGSRQRSARPYLPWEPRSGARAGLLATGPPL